MLVLMCGLRMSLSMLLSRITVDALLCMMVMRMRVLRVVAMAIVLTIVMMMMMLMLLLILLMMLSIHNPIPIPIPKSIALNGVLRLNRPPRHLLSLLLGSRLGPRHNSISPVGLFNFKLSVISSKRVQMAETTTRTTTLDRVS